MRVVESRSLLLVAIESRQTLNGREVGGAEQLKALGHAVNDVGVDLLCHLRGESIVSVILDLEKKSDSRCSPLTPPRRPKRARDREA